MTKAEWEPLLTRLLARHWDDYMGYDECGQSGMASCIKNGYRGVRNALENMPLSDDDAAVYREAIARLKTAKGQYVAFYKDEDRMGMGDGVFGDVAEQLQGRLDEMPGQS